MNQDSNLLNQKERKVGVYERPPSSGPGLSLPLLVIVILAVLAALYYFFLA